jgi:hypothetical protein
MEIESDACNTNKTTKTSNICTKKMLDAFVASVSVDTKYSLDDLKKLLTLAYKGASKKTKDKSEKREPNKYNIFIKDEMKRLREEHPDKPVKELMGLAAANWTQNKNAGNAGNVSTTTVQ